MPIAMRRIGPDRMASVLRSVYPRTANFGIAGTCTLGEALKRAVPGAPIENDVRYLDEPIRDFRLGETGGCAARRVADLSWERTGRRYLELAQGLRRC